MICVSVKICYLLNNFMSSWYFNSPLVDKHIAASSNWKVQKAYQCQIINEEYFLVWAYAEKPLRYCHNPRPMFSLLPICHSLELNLFFYTCQMTWNAEKQNLVVYIPVLKILNKLNLFHASRVFQNMWMSYFHSCIQILHVYYLQNNKMWPYYITTILQRLIQKIICESIVSYVCSVYALVVFAVCLW